MFLALRPSASRGSGLLFFIKVRPDDKIGDAGFVFDGDEHHAFGRAGLFGGPE